MTALVLMLGWPAVIGSLTLAVIAIRRNQWVLMLIGSLLTLPFLLYLAMTPRFPVIAPCIALLYLAGAFALRYQHRFLAVALLAPYMGLVLLVATYVARS